MNEGWEYGPTRAGVESCNSAVANGKSTPQACKEAEIHTQTYYRWRKEYGGLKVEQAVREIKQRARRKFSPEAKARS